MAYRLGDARPADSVPAHHCFSRSRICKCRGSQYNPTCCTVFKAFGNSQHSELSNSLTYCAVLFQSAAIRKLLRLLEADQSIKKGSMELLNNYGKKAIVILNERVRIII